MPPVLFEGLSSDFTNNKELVLRRTWLKLAECTKDINVIENWRNELSLVFSENLSSHVTHKRES